MHSTEVAPARPAHSHTTESRKTRPRDLLRLLRPGQWPKNLVAIPLVVLDAPSWLPGLVIDLLWAIVSFTLASSIVYVGNDIRDRHRDRSHPDKRHRPLASGRVSVAAGLGLLAGLALALATVLSTRPIGMWWPIVVYLLLNLAYSHGLKDTPLVDVIVVALGFQLRLVTGYLAIGVLPSAWLLACVLAACLVLILGKRRHELRVSSVDHRPALHGYSVGLVDQLLVFSAVLAIVTFLLFLGDQSFPAPYDSLAVSLSLPFAVYGLFRYLQVLVMDAGGGNPVRTLFRDRVLVSLMAVWGLGSIGAVTAIHLTG